MSEHRWQGYSHQELFDQIHRGPGPDGSTDSVRRWRELERALGDIDVDLASALANAMAGWQGEAAESARRGLRPLGEWATQAQQAAQVMRERAEQQAEFIGKARTDMPPPVAVRSEDPGTAATLLTHLFGGQTDHEVEEARQDAAERRAFEVMRTYEDSTRANTTALASFAPPPRMVVDTPPAATGTGGPVGQQPVAISFKPAVPVPPGTAGTARSGSSGRGTTGAGAGGTAHRGKATPARGAAAPQRRGGEPVDREVTEDLGRRGGLFDDDRTPAKPVIGGDPR